MADHGINLIAVTAMPWLYDDMRRPASNYQGDAFKYVLDAARIQGMVVEGWGAYPFDRGASEAIAAWITGRPAGITAHSRPGTISHADPMLPRANAAIWLYQFRRWGDLYLQLASGQVPIGVEDTRGWMRQDVNVRHPMGPHTILAFREWTRSKYGRIEDVNAAWGTGYRSFEEIEPEKGQVANRFGHLWEYTRSDHPFHDWNRAVADLDEFRTVQRVANYRDTLERVRKEIPDAVISLRTEGGNVLVAGLDPADPNPHMRHIYYSQRRCAAIADILQASGLIKVHADYTTVPYTPSELRGLVRAAVAQGIVPMYFPQFDNMRDIAINRRYGSDYQVHFNLPEPRKGYMMHCLTALYPWFKATYEEGGIPGILWEDYQCDGFATETQKREMRLFRERLDAALSSPEARRARAAGVDASSQAWREGTRSMRSYRLEP
ncbi:MAG: beta-galactosidase [Planctomycetes bacterium]|nr:beta-galactosidase [Planctomycetota bacterium]